MVNTDIPELIKLEEYLPAYLRDTEKSRNQPAKEIVFASFIQKVFGITPEDFSEKMEVPVASRLLMVKGRIDAVFGNLLFEFKVNVDREIDDAMRELALYFQALHEKSQNTRYLGIATDGIKFKVFKPIFDNVGRIKKIDEIDSLNLREAQISAEKTYLWFDSYLFTSERVPPTTEDLKKRFGVGSPTFAFVKDELSVMLSSLRGTTVATKLENWGKYLEVAYGDNLTSDELFVKHTYLATIAKIIVYLHLYGEKMPAREDIRQILDGQAFQQYGILNFIEEDFFTWILHEEIYERVTDIVVKLLRELVIYDLSKLNEDVFKELYQELVDPEVRHDLGEYYTPDWIAEYILSDVVKDKPEVTILDPSCGSGTFLFTSIKLIIAQLKEQGASNQFILNHILDSIAGVDIHPLAVIISRTNYLLALRNLLIERQGEIIIPVYLSDSIRLPDFITEIRFNVKVYRIAASEKAFFIIPSDLAEKPSVLDLIIQKMYEYSKSYENGSLNKESAATSFENALSLMEQKGDKIYREVFTENLRILLELIDKKANSIWTFVLRNIYKPVTLSHKKFDVVIGNPPWLTLRFIKNKSYRDFLITESKKCDLLQMNESNQLPNLELATLFFRKVSSLYLNEKGTIIFIMPKSVLVSKQHAKFREWDKPRLEPIEFIDLEGVKPLFNVPACVIKAKKL